MNDILPPDFFANTEMAGADDYLRLHLNENPYGPPPGTVAAVQAEADRYLHRYPSAERRELRAALAAYFAVTPDMIAVGNGTDELVLVTTMAYAREPGAQVVLTATTFPGYAMSARSVGAPTAVVPLRDAAIPPDDVAAAMSGAALAFVCNPVNPTGSVLAPAAVERLIETAGDTGCVLAFDEAYMDFADPAFDVAIAAVRAGRRLIVLRTFSKAWGLASVRLGCAIGAPELIERITATSAALPFNVSRPAQQAVVQALRQPQHLDRVRQSNREVRALLCKSLESLGVEYAPSATNFVMARVPGDSAAVAAELATGHHILVRDLSALGLPGYLRISVGTPAEIERLAAALSEVLR